MAKHEIEVPPDSLITPEVGAWAIDKYRMISLYATLFSSGMKYKWPQRVYLDLFSGAGHSRLRGTDTVVAASPILALRVPDQFDRYIFCEKNPEKLEALRTRAHRASADASAVFISGDCNERVDEILESIPESSGGQGVLTLCFVDPYNIASLRFKTIRRLAARRMDFFVLLAVYMDANRNYNRYTEKSSSILDGFLGYPGWRVAWEAAQRRRTEFPVFLAEQFSKRMQSLGYLYQPTFNMKKVRTDEKNLPLYYLALFSRNETAYDFWKKVQKYSNDQLTLAGFDDGA